jgi:hypothetical protein
MSKPITDKEGERTGKRKKPEQVSVELKRNPDHRRGIYSHFQAC